MIVHDASLGGWSTTLRVTPWARGRAATQVPVGGGVDRDSSPMGQESVTAQEWTSTIICLGKYRTVQVRSDLLPSISTVRVTRTVQPACGAWTTLRSS